MRLPDLLQGLVVVDALGDVIGLLLECVNVLLPPLRVVRLAVLELVPAVAQLGTLLLGLVGLAEVGLVEAPPHVVEVLVEPNTKVFVGANIESAYTDLLEEGSEAGVGEALDERAEEVERLLHVLLL